MMAVTAKRPLHFGVQLQAQRTTWPEYLQALRTVEELGFYSVWNFDHLLPFAGDPTQPAFETWTTLAAMAMATSRIRIGALVNGVLYRDPATLAKAAAQVDQISNGRLEFALGAAWAEREFHAYGLPFPPVGERMSRLEEALDIVKALWTQPRTDYHGQYYTINDAPCEPKPVQKPYPPIMIGGSGNRTLRIAAKYADVWNGIGSPEEVTGYIEKLRQACAAIGRNPDEIELTIHPSLAIAATHEEAEAKAQATAASLHHNLDEERHRWLLGTPEEVRQRIGQFVDLGITHCIMAVGAPYDLEGLRLFTEEVLPEFG